MKHVVFLEPFGREGNCELHVLLHPVAVHGVVMFHWLYLLKESENIIVSTEPASRVEPLILQSGRQNVQSGR